MASRADNGLTFFTAKNPIVRDFTATEILRTKGFEMHEELFVLKFPGTIITHYLSFSYPSKDFPMMIFFNQSIQGENWFFGQSRKLFF